MLPVNSNIPLAYQPPQITSPLQLQQQRLTLQQLANTNALQQQAQQENALKIQAQQKDAQDQQLIQQAAIDNTTIGPDGKPTLDQDAMYKQAQSKGVLLKNLVALQNYQLTLGKGLVEMDKAKRDQLATKNTYLGQQYAYLLGLPDQNDRIAAYPQIKKDAVAAGYIKPDDPEFPDTPTKVDDATLKAGLAKHAYLTTYLQQAQDAAKTQQEQQLTQQQALDNERKNARLDYLSLPIVPGTGVPDPVAVANLQKNYQRIPLPTDAAGRQAFIMAPVAPDKLAEVQLQQKLLGDLTSNPQSLHDRIDRVATDPAIQKIGYGRIESAASIPDITKAINETAADQIKKNMETDPDITRVKENVAAAEGATRAATEIKTKDAINSKNEYIQSKADLSTSLAQADEVKTLATRAANGDAVAAKQLPQAMALYAGSLYGVKRQPNGQILAAPGSLEDKVQGWANDLAHGVNYSPDILARFPDTVDALSRTAVQIHNAKTQTTNDVRHTNYPLEPSRTDVNAKPIPPAVKTLLSDPKVSIGTHKLSDGTSWYKSADGTITPK